MRPGTTATIAMAITMAAAGATAQTAPDAADWRPIDPDRPHGLAYDAATATRTGNVVRTRMRFDDGLDRPAGSTVRQGTHRQMTVSFDCDKARGKLHEERTVDVDGRVVAEQRPRKVAWTPIQSDAGGRIARKELCRLVR